MQPIDWACVFAFFVISLVIGLAVTRRAGRSSTEYFAAGRAMPWWLLGVSMVATTFSTDTPNLVADMTRSNGVAGNWEWWAFLLTGMLTVFVYAQLWRRSGVLTDVEFYEVRYSGKAAAFLRGFRALYLGLFFNCFIMASVSLAAIKIGEVLFDWPPVYTVLIAGSVTVIYSTLGGLRGVLLTDLIQFAMAMVGAVGAAIVALNLPDVGGLSGMLSHEAVREKLSILPDFSNADLAIAVFVVPLAVQWWSVWYPGSEPGGGGYIAQRMLSAKDENNAIGAVFLFNALHYALRPWPWIIVALCSLIMFPNLEALQAEFPQAVTVDHDMGYPAMLTFLPTGLLGLVVASLIAAYMSTISTHLNWGSSYIVHDFYQRFMRPESSEKELVQVGRVCTVLLMVIAGALALVLQSALDNFKIMLQIGAGTGLIFILRWFWWRINAFSELTAMIASFLVALYFQFIHEQVFGFAEIESAWIPLCIGIAITTAAWLIVTYLTRPVEKETLVSFCKLVKAGGPGWKPIIDEAKAAGETFDGAGWRLPQGILCMVLGCVAIYGALFATGYWIYGRIPLALFMTGVALASTVFLSRAWRRLLAKEPDVAA
jgi:Na+/proline symporter